MSLSRVTAPQGIRPGGKAALIVAHPGHELKVFGWMAEHRPEVFVLTDGSGRSGVSRLSETARLLDATGARPGNPFGRFSDADIYAAILNKRTSLFIALTEHLASRLVENGIEFVAGDAAEGFNPTHDLCRQMIDAAITIAESSTGATIANFEFCLTEWERPGSERHDPRCLHLRLDDHLLTVKLRSAAEYTQLKDEVQRALSAKGREYFRIECLKQVTQRFWQDTPRYKSHYEDVGTQRVATGEYETVLRYRDHMLPMLEAIRIRALNSRSEAGRFRAAG